MTRIAIYAGSFDPVTNGHIDILRGSLHVADKVFVAIGVHPAKKSLFTFEERVALIRESTAEALCGDESRVEIISFDDLVVDAARRIGATILIRGLRDGIDFDYEMQMAGMNAMMAPTIQTVFLPASAPVRAVTATLVRQIASMGGDVSPFVPKAVVSALDKKFK